MTYQKALNDRLQAARTGLTSQLDLSGLGLTQIPDEVFDMTSLTALRLNASCSIRVEDMNWYLDKMTEEALNPGQFGAIKQSDYLHAVERGYNALKLSDCQLSVLPDRIGELVNLEILELTGQALTELPEALTTLSQLRVLRLARNNLKRLPLQFRQLWALELLDVQKNPLRAWPDGLEIMPLMQKFEPMRQAASRWKKQLMMNQEFVKAAEIQKKEMNLGLHY